MAINPLNFIRELRKTTEDKFNFSQVENALGYSPVGDSINLDHWQKIAKLCGNKDYAGLQVFLTAIEPYYLILWAFLDKPRTTEEWSRQLWNEGRKSTSRRRVINKIDEALFLYENFWQDKNFLE